MGLNDNDRTMSSWPMSVLLSVPLAASQSLIVLSALADARIAPSGLKATNMTIPV